MEIDTRRVDRLINYVKGIRNNENNRELYLMYKEDIESVKPQEAFEIFYSLLEDGMEPKEILQFLDKVINVFYKSLVSYKWRKPKNENFLLDLMEENKALVKRIEIIKDILKEGEILNNKDRIIPKIEELEEFDEHYVKKENILFPYMEKKMERFNGLKIMWALHDEIKGLRRGLLKDLREEEDEAKIKEMIGKFFFAILGLVKKEELILFPTACEVLSEEEWYEMHRQSLEYGFPFILKDKGIIEEEGKEAVVLEEFNNYKIKSETGELDFDQVMLIFNSLPVDLTFVDENNKVKFFTKPKDRIFPRSPAIIGRDVRNCHPPDSVHIVEEIIENFRNGKKDSASFWIDLKGRKLYIQYFAIRDSQGRFKGTLEVSQDITEIQRLEGERRLPDWK